MTRVIIVMGLGKNRWSVRLIIRRVIIGMDFKKEWMECTTDNDESYYSDGFRKE